MLILLSVNLISGAGTVPGAGGAVPGAGGAVPGAVGAVPGAGAGGDDPSNITAVFKNVLLVH